jgi:WG containing repeat
LTVNVLRYPIKFVQGVGIGAVGDKFGVWRADGTTIAPPQYKNARFVADYKRIVLYQNIGLKNWLQLIEPQTGKTLIGTGRYDGISEFYTDYALVSLGEKIGLVDTNGREIVAPISLQNDAYNLMDSLNKASKRSEQHLMGYTDFEGFNPFQEMPINISRNYLSPPDLGDTSLESTSPDSLNLPNALRNRVWHYLLETQVERVIKRADVSKIERAEAFKTYNSYKVYQQVSNYKSPTNTLRHLFADSLYIAFALVSDSAAKSIFKNYWQTKTGWQPKQLSDILNLNRDNILKINDLMRQKIKQLENKDIDCGESTSFVERAENAFLAHAKGISFYFTSSKNNYGDNQVSYVPILLTWAELKAFRTPQ